MSEAIKAKCCECSANYLDGKVDCRVVSCPLYLRMKFRKLIPKVDWLFDKWSKRHIAKLESSGLSKEEYIDVFLHAFLSKTSDPRVLKISPRQMIRAKCFNCCCNYSTGGSEKGKIECDIKNCSLYFWTPYRESYPEYDWMFDVPYTKKHNFALMALGISRTEYIKRVLEEREVL